VSSANLPASEPGSRVTRLILALVLILAAALRFTGLSWGLRHPPHTDERVFVENTSAPVFRLGHPLKIRTIPVYGLVGFRFSPDSTLVPYVTAGAGITSYKEESTVGGITEETSQSKFGGMLAIGADYGRGRLHRFVMNDRDTKVKKDQIIYNGGTALYDVSEGPGRWLYFLTGDSIKRVVRG